MALSSQEFYKKLNIYNYVSISSMFLNKLKFGNIENEDLKKEVRGHYGTTPSLNFALIALDEYARSMNNESIFVLGTGHAGLSLLVYNYLGGGLTKKGKTDIFANYKFTQDASGLSEFIRTFGEEFGYRSEASPFIPNTVYDGDELGYALATSYGLMWNRANAVAFCFVGDGECETGTTFSSFLLNKALKNHNMGTVVPIINLNGFRMGKNSYLSTFTKEQLKDLFKALEFEVYFANNYEQMQAFLNGLSGYLVKKEGLVPLLILDIPKGSFAPITDEIDFAGKANSHKNPLGSYKRELYAPYLSKWLSYLNVTRQDILNEFSSKELLGQKLIESSKECQLILPKLEDFEVVTNKTCSSAKVFSSYCNSVLKNNVNDFIIISPDELTSNKYNALEGYSNNYFEILNENICQGFLQGVLALGKNGIIFAYEGFMPVVCSMISQYLKYTYQRRMMKGIKKRASLNYAITSVVWENCYSHQNPEIINSLSNKEYDFINIYFPLDCNMVICASEKVLSSYEEVNLIVFSKRDKNQYLSISQAKEAFEQGYNYLSKNQNRSDVLIVAIGDTMADVAMDINSRLNGDVIYISKLKVFQCGKLREILNSYKKIAILFHGYKSIIKNFLYDLKLESEIKIYGYKDKSITSGFLEYKLEVNEIDKEEILHFLQG